MEPMISENVQVGWEKYEKVCRAKNYRTMFALEEYLKRYKSEEKVIDAIKRHIQTLKSLKYNLIITR